MKTSKRFPEGTRVVSTDWKRYGGRPGIVVGYGKPNYVEFGTLVVPLVPRVKLEDTGEIVSIRDIYLQKIREPEEG